MEGFTVSMAVVDAVPVLLFGGSMLLVSRLFPYPLFLLGAVLSFAAGCCKVAWKFILGLRKKDIKILNRLFRPRRSAGRLSCCCPWFSAGGSSASAASWPG